MSIKCQTCQEDYDESTRCPLIFSCGHTACKTCVENIRSNSGSSEFPCPYCRTKTSNTAKNYEIIRLIQEQNAKSDTFLKCEKHNSWMDTVCHSCKSEICLNCVVEEHSEHKFSRQVLSGLAIVLILL